MPVPQPTIETRLTGEDHRHALEQDLRDGLASTPKRISPIWFYDERGSRLFEEITRLPGYYLTRAERGLLTGHAGQIAGQVEADTLVELGVGYAEKTQILIDAMVAAGGLERFVALDVSSEALLDAAQRLLTDHPSLEVHGVVADFNRHLAGLPGGRRRLFAFLGSTIGNLTPPRRRHFLGELASTMGDNDHLLLGCDLVKDESRLRAAYDDPDGVTADFNRNALRVINTRMQADFVPEAFDHVAVWNAAEGRMEMYLRAREPQHITIDRLDLEVRFETGEDLFTEVSTKFSPEQVTAELTDAGLAVTGDWRSPEGFLLVLAARV